MTNETNDALRATITRRLAAGEVDAAAAAVDAVLAEGALFWDVVDLFELLAPHASLRIRAPSPTLPVHS